jgi:hypothetical protein
MFTFLTTDRPETSFSGRRFGLSRDRGVAGADIARRTRHDLPAHVTPGIVAFGATDPAADHGRREQSSGIKLTTRALAAASRLGARVRLELDETTPPRRKQ